MTSEHITAEYITAEHITADASEHITADAVVSDTVRTKERFKRIDRGIKEFVDNLLKRQKSIEQKLNEI